jgi:hypothetical protein
MRDRSVNSYDLKEAQLILSSLVPTSGTTPKEPPPALEGSAYVRLAKWAEPRQDSPPSAGYAGHPEEVPPEPSYTQPQKLANWEECLTWCMSLTRAEAAFVVDSQGFIIASRGRVPGHGFEGTGAELICSVEQLERVDPDAGKLQWVELDFDKRRVVGFVTPPRETEYYVIGLMAPDPGYHSLKHVINRQVVENLTSLD